MDNALIQSGGAVSSPFVWKTQRNLFLRVDQMETRHLFNTVVMIWNHIAPAEARTHNYRRYVFGPTYTVAYMKTAVSAMMVEIYTRTDLSDAQREIFGRMVEYLRKNQSFLFQPPIMIGDRHAHT